MKDLDPADGTRIETEQYTDCRDGTEVLLVKVNGGGHSWPGGNQYFPKWMIGPVARDINASELIVEFFLRHKRIVIKPL